MWKPFNKTKKDNSKIDLKQLENVTVETPNTPKLEQEIKQNPKFSKDFKDIFNQKKQNLPKDSLTREELVKEIEKQLNLKVKNNENPFKTKEDMYFTFYNSNMSINRAYVPFEEVVIGGKGYYVNKSFENGKIIINELYANPDVEINLENEFNNKELTKKQLDKINKQIQYIKNQIADGKKEYGLIDIEDLKEEKHRLEKILDSIKYGKSATFIFVNPINHKKCYMLKYRNGEYHYLKITENNYITEENNVRFIRGYEILKKLEDVTNLRISTNWKQIIMGIAIFIGILAFIWVMYEMATFDDELFDNRVKSYCQDNVDFLKQEILEYKDLKCTFNDVNAPSYKQQE